MATQAASRGVNYTARGEYDHYDDFLARMRDRFAAVDGPLLAPVFLFREGMVDSSRKILDSVVDRLTPRQIEVATLLVEGATKASIAETLDVSENTIKSTVRAIFKKLGVNSKAEFIRSMTG